jgi:hypothetical protein
MYTMLLLLLRVYLDIQEIWQFFSNRGILKRIYEQYLYVKKDFPEYIKWSTVKDREYQNRFAFRRCVLFKNAIQILDEVVYLYRYRF